MNKNLLMALTPGWNLDTCTYKPAGTQSRTLGRKKNRNQPRGPE